MSDKSEVKIYFSDFFEIDHKVIDDYGALDISLLSDNPAFVDPFLIFYSKKKEYRELHEFIVKYLEFLKNQSDSGKFSKIFYSFPEVNETWLGFSKSGNKGLGLGPLFAKELNDNLSNIFKGEERDITKSSHLEKLCIIGEGVGVDKISDFTLNLIKSYLVKYTEKFALDFLDKKFISKYRVSKLYFDFEKSNWVDGDANLPIDPNKKSKYVLLTPKDILVKEYGWISSNDFLNDDGSMIGNIQNEELRFKINQYFVSLIPNKLSKKGKPIKDYSKKNTKIALRKTAREYPELIDYFIKQKEESGDKAIQCNLTDNALLKEIFYLGVKLITEKLEIEGFYMLDIEDNSFSETVKRIKMFKYAMENRDCYTIFWEGDNLKKFKEPDVDKMIDLVFASSIYSVDRQVNNGRGPSDIKISKGSTDCTLIETKLAKSTHLTKNLLNQLDIYKEANNTANGVYVILYFTDSELGRVEGILSDLKMIDFIDKWIFLIDCRKKISASKI